MKEDELLLKIKDQKGFTLLEVLVGLLLIALVILAFGQVAVTVIRANYSTELKNTAVTLAQSELEMMRQPGFDLDTVETGLKENIDGVFQKLINISDYQGKADLKQITVNIFWEERGEEKSYFLTTLVYSK